MDSTCTAAATVDNAFILEKLIDAMNALPKVKPIVFKPTDYWYDEVVTQTRKFKSKKKRLLKKFRKKYTRITRLPRENVIKFDNPIDGKIYIIGSYEQIAKIERIYNLNLMR